MTVSMHCHSTISYYVVCVIESFTEDGHISGGNFGDNFTGNVSGVLVYRGTVVMSQTRIPELHTVSTHTQSNSVYCFVLFTDVAQNCSHAFRSRSCLCTSTYPKLENPAYNSM
jgi:hypothetical protein